jgi:hypothetical protein
MRPPCLCLSIHRSREGRHRVGAFFDRVYRVLVSAKDFSHCGWSGSLTHASVAKPLGSAFQRGPGLQCHGRPIWRAGTFARKVGPAQAKSNRRVWSRDHRPFSWRHHYATLGSRRRGWLPANLLPIPRLRITAIGFATHAGPLELHTRSMNQQEPAFWFSCALSDIGGGGCYCDAAASKPAVSPSS